MNNIIRTKIILFIKILIYPISLTAKKRGAKKLSDLHAESNKCYARKQQGVYCLNEVSLHTYIRALQFISERSAGRGFVELLTPKVPPSERPCGAI